jgi:formylmethanofuran dehydrogenase subunit C
MAITLKLNKKLDVTLDADCITPDNFAGKSVDEIKKLPVFYGNLEMVLGDYFDISGKSGASANDTSIIVEGDCSSVYRIGEKMSAGEITIKGNCGMHVGNTMSGGKITVEGNAGAWAGAMMDGPGEGGTLIINGDAGDHCAAGYRGNWIGVNNGKVIVKGKVGVESGSWMRATKSRKKYPILECGSADLYLGVHNHGGTIICHGDVVGRAGADMSHGQIFVEGKVSRMLASYKTLGDTQDVNSPAGIIKGKFTEFEGDYAVSAKPKGRLYVKK